MKIFNWDEIINNSSDFFTEGTGISVGSYDGLHVGHQQILNALKDGCSENHLQTGIFTFTRPLAGVKNPVSYFGDISSLNQRLELLEAAGIDFVILAEFTEDFAKLSGIEFFSLLKDKINLKLICEGVDFRCGYKGSTDMKEISDFANKEGIEAIFVEPVVANISDNKEVRVSSSIIRQLLAEGNKSKAEELLGRNIK
ncbi:MAG: FAD synthetase family protein [Treponema sp.]|nr:FAD synthetase family protein [Treponema sp.]